MMNGSGKFKKVIILLIAASLLLMSLSSCSEESSSDVFLIYYINAAGDDIIYKETALNNVSEMTTEELTDELLKLMFGDVIDEVYYPAKPSEVSVNNFSIETIGTAEDTRIQLTIDFDSNYLEMSNVQEILLRAALVLTMIQQNGVDQVVFTVDGSPLTDSKGRDIGAMSNRNFVNILLTEEGMLMQETALTIYFTDETKSVLIPDTYRFRIDNNNTSMEEYILQRLKEGPSMEGRYRTLSPNVDILSVMTSDYVCYVNFGSNFLEQEQTVSDEIMIYSIVNSLCSLPYVNSVQFLVDGQADVMLHTVMDLSSPLSRNRNLEQ